MRASRLVSILLLLQARGHRTAAELADELEVSVRTIYRDIQALAESGVPIYAERGPGGGVRLVDGYRTRLTGLTTDEAEALFLSGVPGPAAELGLGTVVTAARLKVLAALPPELRTRAGRVAERFHLDAPGWWQQLDPVPCLGELANAVWETRAVTVRYRRDERVERRPLDPLGLVLKGGIWYLVALSKGDVRTFRVSRIEAVEVGERFERPDAFDLARFWSESTARFEAEQPTVAITIRIDPSALHEFERAIGRAAAGTMVVPAKRDPDGWLRVRFHHESLGAAFYDLLPRLRSLEVLAPDELRDWFAWAGERLTELYGAPAARSSTPRRRPSSEHAS
jgi:predicted DNA-binding transcriptional regulator YafY